MSLYKPNPAALEQTEPVERAGYSWALLINLDSGTPPAPENPEEPVEPNAPTPTPAPVDEAEPTDELEEPAPEPTEFLHFYFNPSSLPFSRQANYAEGNIVGANVQPQQWIGTSGSTLRLEGLILDSNDDTKTIQPWLNQIQSYLTAIPGKGRPPELAFVFGEKRYAPCVLESVDWVEEAWVNGLPIRAIVTLVLRKQATEEDLPTIPPEIELVPESTLSGQIQTPTNQVTADGQTVTPSAPAAPGDEAIFAEVSVFVGQGCSGYVVSANQVATAWHCVQGGLGSRMDVRLEDGTVLEGEVIDGDQAEDTALLQVVGHTFTTFAPLGDSDKVKVGDKVVAYGFPGGDPQEERTEGTVTKVNTNSNGFKCHDFSPGLLFPGNSGGLIAAISGDQSGFVIAQTQGGTGSQAKPGANEADGLTHDEMLDSECWGVRINVVKESLGL